VTGTSHYEPVFLDRFPDEMAAGELYISPRFSLAGHLCPCGCQQEVTVKLSPARYQVTFDGTISLYPSIAATALFCNSHYFITRGEVDWHSQLDENQRARAKDRDQRAVEQLRAAERPGIWGKLRRFISVYVRRDRST
jgi:hypothetical protein